MLYAVAIPDYDVRRVGRDDLRFLAVDALPTSRWSSVVGVLKHGGAFFEPLFP